MKANELRDLNKKELDQKLVDCGEELFNLKAQGKTGQLQNNSKIRQLKKDIARIKTIIHDESYHSVTKESK
ncbi:MAG: 50S ribosomal protein L29 [Candidatus Margulisbacteria bacterium]|nr:50S ribosomal protein L29 [Candidatus Margulisiibacteriota bacterium]